MPRWRPRLAAAVLALGLLVLALAPAGTRASITVTPSASTALPPGLTPLPAALDRHMGELVRAAERFRGLRLERPVPRGSIDPPALRKATSDDLSDDLPPAKMAAGPTALQAFGFIPEAMSL